MKIFWMMTALLVTAGSAMAVENDSPPVIRAVKVRGIINKTIIERANGNSTVRSEKVCDFESSTSLYDFAAGKVPFVMPNVAAECTSTVAGKEVMLRIYTFMQQGPWWGAEKGAAKMANASLIYALKDSGTSGTAPLATVINGYAGTRNLAEASLLMQVQGQYDSASGPAQEEVFNATIEFMDDAQ